MSKLFLTDPDNQSDEDVEQSKAQNKNYSFDFKEGVVAELMKSGVPLRAAQVAVIDQKYILNDCFHHKLNPRQTAEMMLFKVEEIYREKDGTWHYQT